MVAVPVKPAVLTWARKERGLSIDDAAQLLEMSEAEFALLERGERGLTLGELERIAQRYQFPLATLLMPAPLPPVGRPRLKDFRAFDGGLYLQLTDDTNLAIDEAHGFVDDLVELREADQRLVPKFSAPKYDLSDDAEEAAGSERERFGVSLDEQFAWQNDREAFLRWRELVEAQGIFAYQLKLGEDDTRGFAIWDDRAIPAVVIDSSEGRYPARVFTIWHEYAHVLLRMGGISDQNRRNDVERFCNQFAAYLLMPREPFMRFARTITSDPRAWTDHGVGKLAIQFRTSKSAVALHLEDLGLAKKGLYGELHRLWRSRQQAKAKGIATHPQKLANRYGTRHLSTIFKAFDDGLLSKLDVFESTAIKPKYFSAVRSEIAGRRAAYGRAFR